MPRLIRIIKRWVVMAAAIMAVYALKRLLNLNETTSAIFGGVMIWFVGTAAYAWLRRS